jgi:calcium-activated chloride channel regulator 4
MTVVNNETRKQLMDKVPSTAGGENCVSCGLQTAIEVTYEIFFNSLYESLESMNKFLFDKILSPGGNGGVIVLVTDGIDSTISDATPELIAAQIQVVSIAFG